MRRCAAVTGAAGMLGTHLVRALLDVDTEVACSDIDCDEPQPGRRPSSASRMSRGSPN